MTELRHLQCELMDYLINKESSAKEYIAEGGLIDREKRLSIYANAYRVRLRGVIDLDHEILSYYLGDHLFDLLVSEYIKSYPSHVPSLRDYCNNIPDFLKENAPFDEYPVLSELARFERLLLYSFDASDADIAAINDLNALAPDAWPDLKLRFHPSVQIFSTLTNCVQIWQSLKAKTEPPDAQNNLFSQWIVWRSPERITEFRSLQQSESIMFDCFLRGGNLAQVCEELLEFHDEQQVSHVAIECISQWLQRGQLSRIL